MGFKTCKYFEWVIERKNSLPGANIVNEEFLCLNDDHNSDECRFKDHRDCPHYKSSDLQELHKI